MQCIRSSDRASEVRACPAARLRPRAAMPTMMPTLMALLALVFALPFSLAHRVAPPNLMFILADDLGHNDVGWANKRTITPHLDALVKGGVELTQWYVFKYCAPTRGMLQTGRFPYHFGFYNNQDANDYGVPANFTFLPAVLKHSAARYRTHAIGKWHNGFRSKELTPTGRGYDTFLGYYHMAEDYYSHRQNVKLVSGCCPGCDGEYLDFSNSTVDEIRPLRTQGGMYSPYVFAAEAQRLMRRHAVEYKDRPIFFYLPFQSVHGPYEAPMEFVSIYNDTIATEVRRIHQGMITAMDEAIGNITQTWNETGLYANSLMWFSSDNGGPLPAANNYPFRGGKFTNWEGGTRVRAFVHSPNLLPAAYAGTVYSGIISGADIFPTFCSVAGVVVPPVTGPNDMDGMDVWKALSTNTESPRQEIFYSPVVPGDPAISLNPEDCATWGQSCGGALRVGDFKLIVGYPGDARRLPLPAWGLDSYGNVDPTELALDALHSAGHGDVSSDDGIPVGPWSAALGGGGGGPGLDGCNYTTGSGCPCHHLNGGPCLFNVVQDPYEYEDLSKNLSFSSIFEKMLGRFHKLSATGVPMAGLPTNILAPDDRIKCAMLKESDAFEPYGRFIPWPAPGAPGPPPPLYQCPSDEEAATNCIPTSADTGVVFTARACTTMSCEHCTNSSIHDACVHEFQCQLRNFSAITVGDCCAACSAASECAQWQYDRSETYQNCVLKTCVQEANPGHEGQCYSGTIR